MRTNNESYCNIFRRIREGRDLTQYQMAELAECSLRNYQNIEAGVSQPSYNTLSKLVKNLRLAPCELFLNKESLKYDSTICEIAVLTRMCSKEQRVLILKIIKDVIESWPE